MCCNLIPRRLMLLIAGLGLVIGVGQFVLAQANADEHAQEGKQENKQKEQDDVKTQSPAALDFKVKTIEGEEVHLSKYHGRVVLIVNTASKCGLTPQYEQLQALHEKYAEQGLSILGFPANNFGKQEPGTNDQIIEFCEQNFGVEFDMFAKVSVKGDDITPLYAYLTGEETNPGFDGEISWNFEKFLVSREGKVVARFSPRTKPDAEKVVKALEAELEKPDPTAKDAAEDKAGQEDGE